jgi:hypothetical protein
MPDLLYPRLATLTLTLLGLLLITPSTRAQSTDGPRLGINLNGPADWNTELPFVDVFRMSRPWISQREGADWGQGPELSLDDSGYPTHLEDGCYAETPLVTINGGHYPTGQYTVLYDGIGEMRFANAEVVASEPGRIVVEPGGHRGFRLQLRATDPDDPVTNIRVVMPGFEDSFEDDPWRPAFLDRWRGTAVIRFMDFMHTNNSHVATWDDRPRMTDATFSRQGVALELMVDLANRIDVDPWFCMPHLADDAYIRQFAQYVAGHLDPELKVYIEYSNEVWNGQFEQSRYAQRQGMALGLADNPNMAKLRFTARRSVEMFNIWRDAFGGTDRLVRVLPSQSANPWTAQQILSFEDAHEHADALAIAPYFGMNVPRDEADAVVAGGLDGVLDRLAGPSMERTVEHIRENAALAEQYGLDLHAYEAGQHAVGIRGGENHDAMTELFHEANASERMGELYRDYFAAWEDAGGDVMVVFSSIGRWSKWGSWGLMEYHDLDPMTQPKMRAFIEQAQAWGQPVEPVRVGAGE